jgi:hypothetical protein
MTACPCSNSRSPGAANRRARHLSGAGLVLGLILGGMAPAWSLSGEPTQLGVPQATPTDPTLPVPPADGTNSGGGIEAAPLPPLQPAPAPTNTGATIPGAPAPESALPGTTQPGTFPAQPATMPATIASSPQAAGLGADLWQGSEVSRLMALVPRLPAPVTVPALRDLQLRLLSSDAPSAGAMPGIDPLQPLRADKLYQMGFSDAALGLGQTSAQPTTSGDPRESVERLLAANNDAAACQQVDAVLAGGQMLDAFFRRAIIFCQIMREQNDAASLGLGLLRETGGDDATTKDFIALAALANGETKREPKLGAAPDGINAALMKMVGMPVGGASVASAVPVGAGGALIVARDAARPLPERVAAAEQAFRNGLMPAAELGELYMQVPAGNADPATAITLADTVELRAQLYQEARRSNQPAQKAKAINAALKQAHRRGDYLNQAQLFAAFADSISPSRDMAWFAAEAARLMFLAGKPDKGGYWLNTVAANPSAFSRPGEREGLELLGRIAGLGGSKQTDPVQTWRQASGTQNARIDLLYALLSGVGDPVSGAGAAPVAAVGTASVEIAAAASGNRKGETILLALAAINGDQAIAADPAALATSLKSLGAIGIAAEARSIAREIAILAGL